MPSKYRFRTLIALCVALVVVLAPQLAGAGTGALARTRTEVVASRHHTHTHRAHHRHRRNHKYDHKHRRHHRHHSKPTPVPVPIPTPTPTPIPVPVPTPTPVPIPVPIPTPVPTPTPTPIPVPVPTPTPVPVPVPTPIPTPVSGECLSRNPLQRVSGNQASRYKPDLNSTTAIDARTATWTQVDDWPVSIEGSGSICWNGGAIVGSYAVSTVWETFHHTGGFGIANPNSIVEDVSVHNYGDAINIRDGASNWRVRGAHTTLIHDDCLQNDYLNAGVISDSLFDGCYVGLSTRASSSNGTSDGHTKTMTLETSLLRLQPMPTVYKGPAPGHGGFFKWDNDAHRSPKLALRNNVFRVDQTPNHGSLGLPEGYDVQCSGNTVVWLGGGAFPEAASWLAKCPDTRIVTSKSTWDNAVATWKAAH